MNNSDILFIRKKNAKLLEKIITGNSIKKKKKTRHERYHDRVYLFIYKKIAHPLMYRKEKTISHLTNEKKNNMNNLPSIKRN